MPTYTVKIRIPFRTPAGRELDTHEQDITLTDPARPRASFVVTLTRYGRKMNFPINIPTTGEDGEPLPDGTRFEIDWPGGVEIPPDHIEVASLERADGSDLQIVKEIYRS
jgi:hypothetical protein